MNDIKEQSKVREERAKSILEKGNPESLDNFTYLVPSQYSDKKYRVIHLDSYSCECEDYVRRCVGTGLYCKHIKAIILFEKLKNAYEVEGTIKKEIDDIIEIKETGCCPKCKSLNLIKRGWRKTSIGDEKQRYMCKECNTRFVLSPIKNIKVNAKYVCLAMDSYYKGHSYRDISDQFKQFYGIELHHETIRRWILKFGDIMEKYSKTVTPRTSGTWNADETLTRTKHGNRERGADYEYVWNVMDKDTKFLLASVTSGHSRNIGDAKAVMKEALAQNKVNPEHIITDRNPSYQEGIRSTFRNWNVSKKKVKHTSIVGHRKQINNNAIENLNGQQKEFQKVRRGINEVQKYSNGFKVFNNFIRKGVKDNKTPAERCGIEVKGNRWETMLVKSLEVPNATANQEIVKSPAD